MAVIAWNVPFLDSGPRCNRVDRPGGGFDQLPRQD